jgi:hypothetical protein
LAASHGKGGRHQGSVASKVKVLSFWDEAWNNAQISKLRWVKATRPRVADLVHALKVVLEEQ